MHWPGFDTRQPSHSTTSTSNEKGELKVEKRSTDRLAIEVMSPSIKPPPPNAQAGPSQPTSSTPILQQSTRFSTSAIRDGMVTRIYRAVRRAIVPASTPSESVGNGTDLERASSSHAASFIRSGLKVKRTASKRSTILDEAEQSRRETVGGVEFDESHDNVDVVVEDADFDRLIAQGCQALEGTTAGSEAGDGTMSHRESAPRGTSATHDHAETESSALHAIANSTPWIMLRWRVWPLIWHFVDSSFADKEKEQAFAREQWYTLKPAALAVGLFYLFIWALVFGLTPQPVMEYTKYTYGVTAAILVAPVFPCVAFNLPRHHNRIWQVVLFLAAWIFPTIATFDPWQCGFYTSTPHCGGKDFIGIVFYPTAMPILALLLLGQKRIVHIAGIIWYIVIVSVLLIPRRQQWLRNLLNIVFFHLACLWAHYLREQADRRMFALRDQLKQQFKATQKAQVAERQASESKRRFVSYIFHEARVPLNTALIALQNLEGENAFRAVPKESEDLVTALSASLVLMEKVLNDVLDFNRMEAGRLVIQNRAFDIHRVFGSVALAFRGAAAARKISLVADLDPAIDEYCPIVKGDETRLLQILSNLLSNSCKFTSSGTIRYATRLLHPTPDFIAKRVRGISTPTRPNSASLTPTPQGTPRRSSETTRDPSLPRAHIVAPFEASAKSDLVIIRIEVADSGVGIKRKDLEDKTMRLFSPYIQTEIGQRQGGKGSGLGLALVRQIVKLSGGRLGVSSRVGSGSTFWLELPFYRAEISAATAAPHHASPSASPNPNRYSIDALADREVSRGLEPNDAHSRAALVASQIPIVTGLDGMPVQALPALTPPIAIETREDPFVKLSCLVVDDDSLTRKLMGRMLTRLGHTVTSAENGLNALSMLRDGWQAKDEFRYQVVFLDNQMPLMSGVEVVREVRRLGSRVYVCGLTGNALRDDQDEYMSAGLSYLLTKPLLERNLRNVLDLARIQLRELDGRPVKRDTPYPTPASIANVATSPL